MVEKVTRIVFIAKDGSEHASERDARAHELASAVGFAKGAVHKAYKSTIAGVWANTHVDLLVSMICKNPEPLRDALGTLVAALDEANEFNKEPSE